MSSDQFKAMFLGSSMQSYPEVNIHVANGKTSLHAAAESGNEHKLNALIEDVNKNSMESATKSIMMKTKKKSGK
jgi:hypothetical protein